MLRNDATSVDLDTQLREQLIRDLVEQYPEALGVLNQYDIDTCCGGGLTIPAAATAHGHDPEAVVAHVRRALSGVGS